MIQALLFDAGVCIVLTLAGVALLFLLRVRLDPEPRLLLAPCTAQAAWACTFGLCVTFGLPVRSIAAPVWAITALLAIAGAVLLARNVRRLRATSSRASVFALPALCAFLPLLTLSPYLGAGLFEGYRGSGVPDGWSYVAYGQYLWEHAQGTEGGLSLLHQYGSNFSHMRHVAAFQLGMLSWLVRPGDTQQGAGLLQAMSIWTLLATSAAFARLRLHSRLMTAAYVALLALSGWVANVVWASNYDNGLALAYLPALVIIAIGLVPAGVGTSVWMGVLAAATIHTYPEFSMVILGCACAVYVVQTWRDCEHPWQTHARVVGAAIALVVLAVLVSPYAQDYWAYLQYQTTVRPGLATFHGLVEARYMLSAFWSLGGEHRATLAVAAQNLGGLLLFAVLAVGTMRLVRRRDWALLALLALILIGAGIVIFGLRYSYGAYKVILIGWWLICYTALLAVATPVTSARASATASVSANGSATARVHALRLAAIAIILAIPGAVIARNTLMVPKHLPPPMANYRVLEDAVPVVGSQRVAILVDQPDAVPWAVYYFRTVHARLGEFALYLATPHLRALVERAEPMAWPSARFVLTDAEDRGPIIEQREGSVVWRGGAYALWDTQGRSWGVVTGIEEPNQLPDARPDALNIGSEPTRITVVSSSPGTLMLSATPPAAGWPAGDARIAVACGSARAGTIDLAASKVPAIPLRIAGPPDGGETACTLRLAPDSSSGTLRFTRVEARWIANGT